MRSTWLQVAALAAAGWTGCSGSPPPGPRIAEAAPTVVRRIDRGPSYMESDIGGLNEEAMEKAFASLERPLQRCLEAGVTRVSELGGHFKLSLRIDRSGGAKWVYLRESTLGDRATEKCVLDLARETDWPRPLGGDGLAEKSFDIDPRAEPISWEPKRVRSILRRARKDVVKCKKNIEGIFTATAYVRPDGRVLSVGVATPSERGEDAADCLVETIRRLRFPSPSRSRAAKISFEIP